MLVISTASTRIASGRRHERPAARPCAEILEGRELMASFAGHGFAAHARFEARLAALHARQAHMALFRTHAVPIPKPGHIVSNPALISPVDPFGQYRTNATMPAPAATTPSPTHIVSNPSLISPVDPLGQFQTRAAATTAAAPTPKPGHIVSDPSLISPVDPYGQYRTN
jgi:rRNA maturation protein Nop10